MSRQTPVVFCYGESGRDIPMAELDITAQGRQVEAGEADWLALHPIDTWLGGIHLHPGGPLWRWDNARGRLVTDLA